jgi:hypothetical protein
MGAHHHQPEGHEAFEAADRRRSCEGRRKPQTEVQDRNRPGLLLIATAST